MNPPHPRPTPQRRKAAPTIPIATEADGTVESSEWNLLIPTSVRRATKRIWDQLSPHLALALGALATVAIAMRVLYVANFDPTVALAIVQQGGAATILAMLLQTLPGVIGGVAGILAIVVLLTYVPPPPYGPRDRSTAILGGIAFVVALSVAPLSIIALLSFVAIVLMVLLRRDAQAQDVPPARDEEGARAGRPVRWVGSFLLAAAAIAIVGQLLVATGLWLPAERFRVRGEEVVGYAIDFEGEWATLLIEDGRSVQRVLSGDITSRELCSIENTAIWDRPWYAVFAEDVTPDCGAPSVDAPADPGLPSPTP